MGDEVPGTDKLQALREAEEFGCHGLVAGSAQRLRTRQFISASVATQADGPFICGVCLSDAVLRKCTERRDHFAHVAPKSPALHAGESTLHRACKEDICAAMALAQPDGKWAVERCIPAHAAKDLPAVVPDVSGRVGGHRLVIEVQASALSISSILKRTRTYARRGISILFGSTADRLGGRRDRQADAGASRPVDATQRPADSAPAGAGFGTRMLTLKRSFSIS